MVTPTPLPPSSLLPPPLPSSLLPPSLLKVFKLPEGEKLTVITTLKGSDITGIKYTHPLFKRESMVVAGGDYITTESGTGLVHTAPGEEWW